MQHAFPEKKTKLLYMIKKKSKKKARKCENTRWLLAFGTGENQRLIQFCPLSNHNDQNSLNFQPNLCPKNRHMLPHFVLGLEQQNVRDAKPGVL